MSTAVSGLRVLLVSGTRHATANVQAAVESRLSRIPATNLLLITGGARGVDTFAYEYGKSRRWDLWKLDYVGALGRGGGHFRNSAMGWLLSWNLERGANCHAICFPRGASPGTRGMIRQLENLGISPEVIEVEGL